jgi:hypothetical protein
MSYGSEENKLLLNYSDTLERATLVNPNQNNDEDEDSMPSRRRGRKGSKGGRRRKTGGSSKRRGVRVNKGRLGIRVAGYQGVQSLTASELVRHIPLSKLRAAAKKVLKRSGAGKTKRKGKKRGRKRKRKH